MRTVALFLIGIISFFLHLMLSPAIAILGAKPDFIMLTVVLLAAFTQKWYPPVIFAVYSGIFLDVTTQAGTFVNTGIYLFFAACAAAAALILKEKNCALVTVATFAAVAFKYLIFVFLLYIMRLCDDFTLKTFFNGLPNALYTGVAAVPCYFLFTTLFKSGFMREKKKNEGRFL